MISYEPLFQTMKEKQISSYGLEKRGFPRSTYYAIKHGKGIVTPCVGVYLAQYILNSNFAL